jgi:hypothetical protein
MRVSDCTWWDWDGGSTPFFWRWPEEFRSKIRDGTPRWFDFDQSPAFKRPQRDEPDPNAKSKTNEKQTIKIDRIYFEEGLVKSLTTFFVLAKWDFGIHMVYDGTLSRLNMMIWAPWFSLPNINTLLRIVETGIFMGDTYIGEMFLNFFLDPNLRKCAGVNSSLNMEVWWVMWARISMGMQPSPFIAVQIMDWLEEIIFGYPRDKGNVFTLDIKIKLPGRLDYDPSMSWAYKLRLNDGKIAAYLLLYIDNARLTGTTEEM